MSTQAVESPSLSILPVDTRPVRSTPRVCMAMLSPALAAGGALLLHVALPNKQARVMTETYPALLRFLVAGSLVLAAVHMLWDPLKRWMRGNAPLLAGGILILCVWDLITLKFAWMPLPYFPGPDTVLQALVEDRVLLLQDTYHSLLLLLTGYFIGVFLGVVSGVLLGWFGHFRYWGMPFMKLVGPNPATAFIPLVMLLFTSNFQAEASLIALAVWFPVTMLTTSGIANVPVSYLDVARTLGAGRFYLIFRVAIPAALPNIFLGLFMGLLTSFLTLIAAETMGVQAGLGYYLMWQRSFAQFANMYAALLIMMFFFSGIMSLLFKVRDRVLVWQKGVLRW